MTTVTGEQVAELFEAQRPHLLRVAYRLLGTLVDAEDAVQEAWLRLRSADVEAIADLRAWLTTVVSRICLDELRSARVRREQYVGPWLPEPVVAVPGAAAAAAGVADPADRVTLDESVSMAMLVVLESLSPAERTAFVLHDVFAVDFEQIAQVVGRTPAACRQLASRARRHVRDRAPRFTTDPAEHARVVTAFARATQEGDLAALVGLLDPGVVWRADGGGVAPAARRVVAGVDRVSRILLGYGRNRRVEAVPATVNGGLGFVLRRDGAVVGVMAFGVANGRIVEIDTVTNPAKLARLSGAAPS